MKAVNSTELARVTEPKLQYGAEALEAHQKEVEKAMNNDNAIKNVSLNSGKSL